MWEDIALYANCSNIAMNAEDGANPKKSTHEAERRYEVRPDLGGF